MRNEEKMALMARLYFYQKASTAISAKHFIELSQ